MDEYMIYIYIHDTNRSYMGIGYIIIEGVFYNIFNTTMVG